jgi:hypothetical protein
MEFTECEESESFCSVHYLLIHLVFWAVAVAWLESEDMDTEH